MTHHHHHHDDDNHSSTGHGHQDPLSFNDKIAKLLEHWIDHNNSHRDNYLSWAGKAEEEALSRAASLLKEAALASDTVTEKLEAALKTIKQ
ncbi:MAG: hypothetical protein R6V54_13330 [Desulfobacteraceae bacterium]